MPAYRSIKERFANKYRVNQDTGCWDWVGCKVRGGYGHIKRPRSGGPMSAHRFAYEHFVGHIPDGMIVRHSCHNPGCVNPAHLLVGTHADNMRDMAERGSRIGRNAGTTLDGRQIARLKRLLLRRTQQEAADAIGIHRTTVQRAIYRGDLAIDRDPNAPAQRKFLSNKERARVLKNLRAGLTVSEVARAFDVDRKTVRNIRDASAILQIERKSLTCHTS